MQLYHLRVCETKYGGFQAEDNAAKSSQTLQSVHV